MQNVSPNWFRVRVAVAELVFLVYALTPAVGKDPPQKPRIRAITAFVRIDASQYRQEIESALTTLRGAKAAFERGGFEVQTIRITTQPFPEYIGERSEADALQLFQSMDELSKEEGFLLDIGPVTRTHEADSTTIELLSHILASTRANATLVVADEGGVNWKAVRAAARVMKYLENHTPNGVNNFDFAAVAMVPPNGPFFPASNHDGPGHTFAVGWEAGAFVQDLVAGAHGDMTLARELLSRGMEEQAATVERIATKVEKESGWSYLGLDPTPAPGMDSSIGAALEKLMRSKFGGSGTLSAAAVVTESERSISAKRTGYSGLMLPVLEDQVLADRWSEGTFDLDSLLAYSAVCGTGLDAIPLPGDVSQEQLEKIIGDMASLAFKWHKPLTARLIPAPGKKAGDRTNFDFGVANFPNVILKSVR